MADISAVARSGCLRPTQTVLLDSVDVCAWPPARAPREAGAGGEARPGDRLGRFIIKGVLGEGGMSVVYDAFDPRLERAVALKQIKLTAVRGPYDPLAEARALARLNHPNVVTIYDLVTGETDGLLALERIDGITLRAWLAECPHTTDEILDVLLEAASGLAAAHAAGVVHRDFKPDNVLVGRDGRVRITDFGLAMRASARIPTAAGRHSRLCGARTGARRAARRTLGSIQLRCDSGRGAGLRGGAAVPGPARSHRPGHAAALRSEVFQHDGAAGGAGACAAGTALAAPAGLCGQCKCSAGDHSADPGWWLNATPPAPPSPAPAPPR